MYKESIFWFSHLSSKSIVILRLAILKDHPKTNGATDKKLIFANNNREASDPGAAEEQRQHADERVRLPDNTGL